MGVTYGDILPDIIQYIYKTFTRNIERRKRNKQKITNIRYKIQIKSVAYDEIITTGPNSNDVQICINWHVSIKMYWIAKIWIIILKHKQDENREFLFHGVTIEVKKRSWEPWPTLNINEDFKTKRREHKKKSKLNQFWISPEFIGSTWRSELKHSIIKLHLCEMYCVIRTNTIRKCKVIWRNRRGDDKDNSNKSYLELQEPSKKNQICGLWVVIRMPSYPVSLVKAENCWVSSFKKTVFGNPEFKSACHAKRTIKSVPEFG